MFSLRAASIAVAVALCGVPLAAQAVTVNDVVDFNGGVTTGSHPKTYTEAGFQFYDSRIVGGQCAGPAGDKCEALNKHQSVVLTRVDGMAFNLTSIWFYLDGKASEMSNALAVFDTNNTSHSHIFDQTSYTHNTAHIAALDFFGVTSITIASAGDNSNQGNARFDFVPAAVPIPASGLLLVGAIGGLAALRRRKSA